MAGPIPNTCPDIDRVIRSIRAAIKSAEGGLNSENPNSITAYFQEVIDELEWTESTLEDLREANSNLRSWGLDKDQDLQQLQEKISDIYREF